MAAQRADGLTSDLRRVAAALIATVEQTDPELWSSSLGPGVWSIGKEVEHVAEAATYHQWIVRRTIGDKVPARKPVLEREQMTTRLTVEEAIILIRRVTEDGASLIGDLSDAQLSLPTVPARARDQRLAETIEAILIGYLEGHRREIEAKQQLVQAMAGGPGPSR